MAVAYLIPKFAFAWESEDFVRGALQFIEGGMGEFFKAELGRANGCPTYSVGLWDDEVGTILDSFLVDYLELQRMKGKNQASTKKKALEDAISSTDTKRKWEYACNAIVRQIQKSVDELRMPDKAAIEAAYWT